jgi:hypothetical protein
MRETPSLENRYPNNDVASSQNVPRKAEIGSVLRTTDNPAAGCIVESPLDLRHHEAQYARERLHWENNQQWFHYYGSAQFTKRASPETTQTL